MRLVTIAVAAAAALLVWAAPAMAAGRRADTACAGLRVTKTGNGAVESVKVSGLHTARVSCATARAIARQIAKDLLSGRSVPKRIGGFGISVGTHCEGCAPSWPVTAKGSRGSFGFTALGGA
jgi:hypothetical protein